MTDLLALAPLVVAIAAAAVHDALTGRDMRTMQRHRTIRQALRRSIVTGAAASDARPASSRQAEHGSAGLPQTESGCARQGGRGPGSSVPLRSRIP